MPKRKAPNIRQALGRAAEELWKDGRDINSLSLARTVHAKHSAAFEADLSDLAEVGLMVMAGRISTAKADPVGVDDLFEKEGYTGFYRVRFEEAGRIGTKLIPSRIMSPKIRSEQPPKKNRTNSKRSKLDRTLDEMIVKGLFDMCAADYVNSK